MKFIIDIPSENKLSGGITRMKDMCNAIREKGHETQLHLSVNENLLNCDYVISYSDNPRIDKLCEQAKKINAKVIIYLLSYGMAIDRENKVINHPDTIICCSTMHILNKIKTDKKIYYIGHSQESTLQNFYPEKKLYNKKCFDVAIMTHKSPDKNFLKAFEYCKSQKMKICLFGVRNSFFDLSGASRIVFNANIPQLRWIYSNSEKYLNLSTTEGLNRLGIEAMLCRCKPYVVDVCEIYEDRINCKIIKDPEEIKKEYKLCDADYIYKILSKYTWKSTLKKLSEIIGEKI